jgi:ectoine hydroxylase-related dioxygenase (phytanoyl-CoA dioxygenase family)
MSSFQLTPQQIASYQSDGYLVVPNFLDEQEVNKLYKAATEDETMNKNAIDLNDQQGKKTKLALWFTPGNDIYGVLTKSERIVKAVDLLLDGNAPVCHYHSKLMMKEPKVGGAWEWHQDYGYWYRNEFLFPDQMISVMVAITEANKENGCLQVIKGSHKMGRVEHGKVGEQAGASQRFVDLALDTLELVYVELKPGDCLFFHSNILHRSEANLSDRARWSLISAYNRQSNPPHNDEAKSSIVPLVTVADELLLQSEITNIAENSNFLSQDTVIDKSHSYQ